MQRSNAGDGTNGPLERLLSEVIRVNRAGGVSGGGHRIVTSADVLAAFQRCLGLSRREAAERLCAADIDVPAQRVRIAPPAAPSGGAASLPPPLTRRSGCALATPAPHRLRRTPKEATPEPPVPAAEVRRGSGLLLPSAGDEGGGAGLHEEGGRVFGGGSCAAPAAAAPAAAAAEAPSTCYTLHARRAQKAVAYVPRFKAAQVGREAGAGAASDEVASRVLATCPDYALLRRQVQPPAPADEAERRGGGGGGGGGHKAPSAQQQEQQRTGAAQKAIVSELFHRALAGPGGDIGSE